MTNIGEAMETVNLLDQCRKRLGNIRAEPPPRLAERQGPIQATLSRSRACARS